ncbi:MAG: aryl-sulfate sulfotransferase [Pseudomonadales bacterium]|nr:aryl-sulfate sulfotransferase [Pseudomonadales bacterium]
MAWLSYRPIGLTHTGEGTYSGYTLFCSVRGHHATIIDMAGQIVHQWHHDEGIQHVKLLENGNLLIQTLPPEDAGGREKIGGSAGAMIELTPEGKTVWEHRDIHQHHDYIRLDTGNTVYLAWEPMPGDVCRQVRGAHKHEDDPEFMWGDVVREIDATGKLLREWRSWEHLDFDEEIICPLESFKEWTHINSIEVLENGDWLMSLRLTSTVIIVDGKSGEVKWRWGGTQINSDHDPKKWGPAELSHQHNAQMLENGNILVFDNGCHRKRGPGFSRIVEIDPETRAFVWSYTDPTVLAFYSFMVSGCERLPNGNTLITEGASGRIMEVSQKHKVVWEYISPWTVVSSFGPTPAVFRSYRIAEDDPRLASYNLSREKYADLNQAIAKGEVQTEKEYLPPETD